MAEILFTKMQGAGNDYIYIDCLTEAPSDPTGLAVRMSDRHFGVGGDGIVLILPSDRADFRMRMFNADGSEAQMCGNATRCIAKYVYDNGLTDQTTITLDTLAGIKILQLHLGPDGKVDTVTVDMGAPEFVAARVPALCDTESMIDCPVSLADGRKIELTAVSMGNPHGVAFVPDLSQVDVHAIGRELEINPIFPEKANIEFAEVIDPGHIRMRVWERGSGETLACGTGACATVAAAIRTGRCGSKVTLSLLGGQLTVEQRASDGHLLMTGPARTVFTGTYTY